ncbi:MAG: FAD-binding oxidoreductase [Rhodospirillales bacterium]|jgi:D-lactate dehydrogenase (cytochrome)|nr:FAD-binding oxidoreductase [Rhodospirillales bacterium]
MMTTGQALAAIRTAVGPKGWIDEAAAMESYLKESRGLFRGHCAAVVRPASTAQTAEVVRLCAAGGLPITPQGGNTGHVGGSVPEGGIILSVGRMNRIRTIDPLNHTMTVEAGCILADIQRAAETIGCLFPLSMASEGSCQIGGNLSTNAGGIAVLRYGNAREQVMGLEVVLPDGQIWNGLRGLRKDNTGYDLKHLFIGAEGTLGIITAAVLKLYPHPKVRETALAGTTSVQNVLDLFAKIRDAAGDTLTGFEMMPRIAVEFSCRHTPGVTDPFAEPHRHYALIELTSPRPGDPLRDVLQNELAQALESGLIADAVVATSLSQADALWAIREAIPEAQKHEGGSIKHDISVPVSRIADFMDRAIPRMELEIPGVRVCAFGHVGDGNIHFNLSQPIGADKKAFLERWQPINRIVNAIVADLGGSISAEHGIGRLKTAQLREFKPEPEIAMMRRIKAAFDPTNIMNPGKVIPPQDNG